MYFQTGVSLIQHLKITIATFYTINYQNSLLVSAGRPYEQAQLDTASHTFCFVDKALLPGGGMEVKLHAFLTHQMPNTYKGLTAAQKRHAECLYINWFLWLLTDGCRIQ
jgi:hypothetical protein